MPLVAAGGRRSCGAALVVLQPGHTNADHPTPVQPGTHVSVPARRAPHVAVARRCRRPNLPSRNAVGLRNFAVNDGHLGSPDTGWALGTADCLKGSGACVVWRTRRRITLMAQHAHPPVNIGDVNGCADPCVERHQVRERPGRIRFRQSAFFMTD